MSLQVNYPTHKGNAITLESFLKGMLFGVLCGLIARHRV